MAYANYSANAAPRVRPTRETQFNSGFPVRKHSALANAAGKQLERGPFDYFDYSL